MVEERRCPSCGALVFPDAEWCGQCYTPLRNGAASAAAARGRSAARTDEAGRTLRGIEVEGGKPAWTCPVCETTNPIEVSVCGTCGTPFARLLEEPEERPEIDPQSAAVWSMALPGLGHWKLGRRVDAIARFAMFGWAFGALLILLVSRFGKGGLGPTFPLFLLFVGASAGIYVVTVVDSYRLASGEDPVLSSRTLLWVSVGLVLLSVMIATFVTLPAARR